MKMRETIPTLRAYFILSGLASLFYSASTLHASMLRPSILGIVVEVINTGFSLAFLYVGFFLAGLLASPTGRIVRLLYASAGLAVLVYLLGLLHGQAQLGLVPLILTLLILWYLLKNVRRLSAEAEVTPGPSTPTPDLTR